MKPEPLKNKKIMFNTSWKEGCLGFEEDEIKSAVDYLKREILYTSIQKLEDDEIDDILNLIDKCFEDVIDNENR